MAKKCIPGVICINHLTLVFIIIVLFFALFFLVQNSSTWNASTTNHSHYNNHTHSQLPSNQSSQITITRGISQVPSQDIRGDVGRCTLGGGTVGDPLTNPYVPPVKCDAGGLMTNPLTVTIPSNAVPVNIPTQHYNTQYNQVGILTKQSGSHSEILPLMGRRTVTSRDKWQYYTVAGGGAGGNLQTKLPVKVKGRSCSSEYGCEEIYNGDVVYVEGYQDMFQATVYESGLFSYIPI